MTVRRSLRVAVGVAMVAGLALPRDASADTINVLCSNGFKAVMQTLAPQFEQATKHKVVVVYSVAAELKRRIDAGEPFDLAILTPAAIDDLIARRAVSADTRSVLARSPMAIAVRSGTPKPDISTTEAFTRALSQAKSIAYAREGATGVFFAETVQRLGLAEIVARKALLAATGDEVGAAIARGDAELGVLPVSEILAVPGLEILGRFPRDVEGYVTMVAGVSAAGTRTPAVHDLVRFLTAPAQRPILEQKGMESQAGRQGR